MKKVALMPFEMGGESGIKRVISAHVKYLPKYGWQPIDATKDDSYNVSVSHAGMYPFADVLFCHGLYWTADYNAALWEWATNAEVIECAVRAKQIVVPSNWVAETFQRDMRLKPVVVPHGVDWDEWQWDNQENRGYILWNKNRDTDVCDPIWVGELANRFPDNNFLSTFSHGSINNNVRITGVVPHNEMSRMVVNASVYLSTTKETFGIGTLEALAAGVPVLGFRHGGNIDLVQHGINGYLAEPGNLDDLANGLDYVLRYRDTLSSNARELARQFTWERSVEKFASVLDGVISRDEDPSCALIVPSYNYGDRVSIAIQSAINQDYPLLDAIIVVDDGSQDNTAEVVRSFAELDPRVQYVYQDNAGVANARNRGIELAKGVKYICCLDADDMIQPSFLSKCIEPLERDRSLGIAYTSLAYVTPDGKTGVSDWPSDWKFDRQLLRENQIPTCCVFRREMWERLGGYKQRYAPMGAGAEDAEFWTRAGAYGFAAIRATEEPLFVYSFLSGRVSGNRDYKEVDWLSWHPWVKDGQHPFASCATPKKRAHPVRQYDEPIISVIIPVSLKHVDKLRDALDSLESQTFRKWEAVVVWDFNEGDVDISSIQKAYPYIREAFSDKRGAGAARNMGVDLSRASLILFLDADDWLTPNALDIFLEEYARYNGIIYSDYLGRAFIDDRGEIEKLRMRDRLVDYNEKTHEAIMAHKSEEYDCAKAQAQPNRDMYIWSLITSLLPKQWHYDIGGFDESMESWEDWDYWIRMARAGKCFYLVHEQLVIYRFYTGERREHGLQSAPKLIEYLLDKYEGGSLVGCGCQGNKNNVASPGMPSGYDALKGATPSGSAPQKGIEETMKDEDFVLVTYEHPNRGQHKVIGAATGTVYGYRGGGEKFYVHVNDIAVQPAYFVRVPEPSKQIVTPKEIVEPPAPPRVVSAIDAPATKEEVKSAENNLSLIPGVTPVIAEQMTAMGITTIEDIVSMGKDKLMEIKGIGLSRATAIFERCQKLLDAKLADKGE